jgi:ABC-2 type transport system permease protein
VLGYVWQVMRPLLLFGVLYVFFVLITHVGQGGKPSEAFYGVQLLGSIVLFTFFGEATGGAVRSVFDRENLVRKIQFPRMVIPLAIVLLSFFNLLLNLVVVLLFALISGVTPMLSWLELPLILLLLVVFSTGLAMLLSALFVRFRDISPIWEVVSQIIFYGSPVIIPLAKVRETLLYPKPPGQATSFDHILYHLYMLNPLVTVFQQFRHAMVTHATISAGEALGSWVGLLEPLGVAAATFALGFWVFNRSAPFVAENL